MASNPKLREEFDKIDKNGDGKLSAKELIKYIFGDMDGDTTAAEQTLFGWTLTSTTLGIKNILDGLKASGIDANKDGFLDFDEYVVWMTVHLDTASTKTENNPFPTDQDNTEDQ